MNGKIICADDNHREFTVYLDQPASFKLGQEIVLNLKKQIRTIPQNCLYWVMLDWVIHPNGGGLCRQGRLSRDGLHCDIKSYMEENHRHDFPNAFDEKGHFTTAKLTRYEFGLFFDFVNKEIMIEFFELDMSPFWTDYDRLTEWATTNPGGMSEYLRERMPF